MTVTTPRPAVGRPTGTSEDRRARVGIRLDTDDKERADYWARRRGYPSTNEYMAEAVAEKIRRENQDYDLPTLEIARVNELADRVQSLTTEVANVGRIVTSMADTLIGLTRGDNYLLDDEDGHL